MSSKINIIGKRFGKLTVMSQEQHQGRWLMYNCLCDCGKNKIVNGNALRSRTTRSCGCLKGQYSRLPDGVASCNALYSSYRSRALRMGKTFSLTKTEFRELTSSNCYYCGDHPQTKTKNYDKTGIYIYNGLDRVDNTLGYTSNNVVACCWQCNQWKRALTQQAFLEHINKIAKYQGERNATSTNDIIFTHNK